MDKHFKFQTLPHDTGTVANVFIHGYSAGHDLRDRRQLARHIPATLHGGVNIFAFWRSGHILQLDRDSILSIAGAFRNSPYSALGTLAVDRVRHFTKSRLLATTMGEVLFSELDNYLAAHHPKVSRVNLVGHSLGGRVLVSALRARARQADHSDFTIGDVLLMAAAVEVGTQEAAVLKSCIEGELINAWSSADTTLRFCVDEYCLGRRAVEHFKNVAMDGFGHKSYWPQLHKVLADTGFAGFKGQHYPALIHQEDAPQDDHVRDDYLLHDLFELAPPTMLDEAIKHLQTSSWTRLDHSDRLYGFTREFQLVAGHCLINLARQRGLPYAEVLEMLVSHFELGKALHHCGTILEVEAALVSRFFGNSFGDDHPLCGDTLAVVRAMPAQQYFRQVDALAERLTLASCIKPAPADAAGQVPATTGLSSVAAPTGAMMAATSLGNLIGNRLTTNFGRALTNFMSAVKPGYSALIPTVAIVFYARARLGNPALMI